MSLYLKGALYAEWREVDKALPYLLNATEKVKKITDFQLGHLIHLEIGSMYVYRVLYQYAEKSFQKSLEYATKADNKVYIASSLLYIVRVEALTKSYEISIPYYEEAIEITKLSENLV